MPAVSKSQFRLMAMAAHGKSSKVPQDVAKEFLAKTRKSFKSLPERKTK